MSGWQYVTLKKFRELVRAGATLQMGDVVLRPPRQEPEILIKLLLKAENDLCGP